MSEKVVILGAGESGVGAALLAKAKGLNPFVSDAGTIRDPYREELEDNSIPFEEGGHTKSEILQATQVVKSPGIPDHIPMIEEIRAKGIPVISELEFAYPYSKARFVSITGSNGKTTTTLLAYHILKEAGFSVGLAGNVGYSLARQVIENEPDFFVLEVSSFQLDGMYHFKSNIAILLNITPDHLDRYEYNFQKYIASKFRITQNLGKDECFIYFADDVNIRQELAKRNVEATMFAISLTEHVKQGGYLEDDHLMFIANDNGGEKLKVPVTEISLIGKHNLINTMAAVLACLYLDTPMEKLIRSLRTFKNVPHRLEKVGDIGGITFINDSKATNVDAVGYALDAISEPIVWIAGGVDKGNDYGPIQNMVGQKVKGLVSLGKDNTPLRKAFNGIVPLSDDAHSMNEAITKALQWAQPGDVVLLSPACASFDLFKNYEQRGDSFKEVVSGLSQVSNQKIQGR